MDEVREHPLWEEALEDAPLAAQSRVNAGCPTGPSLYDEIAGPEFGEYVADNQGRWVDQASPYRVHVYVLPEEEILRVVGPPENIHSGTEELVCAEDSCTEVTDGLYVSATRLDNMALLVRELSFDLGLP
jgi:hypothetical protein